MESVGSTSEEATGEVLAGATPQYDARAVAPPPAATGGAMTRSEEQARFVPGARRTYEIVRLRKVIVTEERTITVPVRREQLVVERVAVSDLPAPRGPGGESAVLADAPSEGYVEITLSEEEVVVDTRVVPRERVRVTKELVTEQRRVEADVRKERIDVEREPLATPPGGRAVSP